MKVLNLTNKDKSEIKWELSQFPDGQQQIRILSDEIIDWGSSLKESVLIKAHLNNFLDLEKIVCATQSLKFLGVRDIQLYVPYILGSRSDRSFNEGENSYLKHVLCPIINLQGYTGVITLDPHSDCLEMGLNGFKKVSNENLISFALNDLDKWYKQDGVRGAGSVKNCVLISPDAGASKKVYKLQEYIKGKHKVDLEVITCSKDRDKDGKLTKCVVPKGDNGFNTDHNNKDIIIIDDICDGGGTFMNIAKEFRKGAFKGNIYLVVTHSIFSKGLKELNEYFDGIYTTNSYLDLTDIKSDFVMRNERYLGLVKQMNVF